ncbi:SDR family oxidoreductase [Lonsdalea quercina]|uniref:SDR family oxidoreductase n=1 Tax=Lonsdalea quercina TaxID=71657 RepID=UPI00397504C9
MMGGSAVIDLTLARNPQSAIRVNAVTPTGTPTIFWRAQSAESVEQMRQRFAVLIPRGRTTEIEALAAASLFLMKNDFITGQQRGWTAA